MYFVMVIPKDFETMRYFIRSKIKLFGNFHALIEFGATSACQCMEQCVVSSEVYGIEVLSYRFLKIC